MAEEIKRDDLEDLLFELEDLYYNYRLSRDLILNYIRSYICIFFKDDIDSFINDLEVGDRYVAAPSFINDIKRGLANACHDDLSTLYFKIKKKLKNRGAY